MVDHYDTLLGVDILLNSLLNRPSSVLRETGTFRTEQKLHKEKLQKEASFSFCFVTYIYTYITKKSLINNKVLTVFR